MSVRVAGDTVFLEGAGTVEDAEPLLVALQDGQVSCADLSGSTRLHMAVVQVLVASGAALVGRSNDNFIQRLLVSAIDPRH